MASLAVEELGLTPPGTLGNRTGAAPGTGSLLVSAVEKGTEWEGGLRASPPLPPTMAPRRAVVPVQTPGVREPRREAPAAGRGEYLFAALGFSTHHVFPCGVLT